MLNFTAAPRSYYANTYDPAVTAPPAFDSRKTKLGEIHDLVKAAALMSWDQQTIMPPRGSESRAQQLGTIGKVAHETFISDEIGQLLDELRPFEESLDRDSFEASLIRVARRDFEKAIRVPPELFAEISREGSRTFGTWVEARANSDYERFRPRLERMVELKQRQLSLEIVRRFGFDETAWRLDTAPHPFAQSLGTTDIRITTREPESSLDGLFATMHECGHGLYENGVDPVLERTPLARGASLGLHESQSRLWENLVGRCRPFWSWFYPRLQEAFPRELGSIDEETWFRAINDVRPGLIRIEADEASYNLHIILRFELEQQIMAGLDLRELPDAWNEAMSRYLGVDVPDDARGVLQDVHWSR